MNCKAEGGRCTRPHAAKGAAKLHQSFDSLGKGDECRDSRLRPDGATGEHEAARMMALRGGALNLKGKNK